MTIPVLMPKIGLTMKEGKIVEWKKSEGEWVEKEEILFVFETEKVTIEVEAPQSGFLVKILVGVDEVAAVGAQVAMLAETRDEAAGLAAGKEESVPAPVEERIPGPGIQKAKKIRATPLARRLARERGIDLGSLASDAGGRIRAKDVETACADAKPAVSPAKRKVPMQAAAPCADEGRLVKLSGMRRLIAQKMLASKLEAAHTYMVVSVNAEKLLDAKERLKAAIAGTTGVSLTLTDLLMKITASAILRHPVINTRWSPEGIVWLDAVHMGMAMALDEGLIVPVIRNIESMPLGAIAKKRAELVEKGRAGKLLPEEMRGSTFTVSSLGMFGVEEFSAIINQPESAILAVGAVMDKPVVIGKEVAIRPIMKLTLSYDHRVIDGAKAAAFIKTLKELTEDPILILA